MIHFQTWLPQAILVSDWPISGITLAFEDDGQKAHHHQK
jgi:hypothetical protein